MKIHWFHWISLSELRLRKSQQPPCLLRLASVVALSSSGACGAIMPKALTLRTSFIQSWTARYLVCVNRWHWADLPHTKLDSLLACLLQSLTLPTSAHGQLGAANAGRPVRVGRSPLEVQGVQKLGRQLSMDNVEALWSWMLTFCTESSRILGGF